MTKQIAKVVTKQGKRTPNGRERIMEIRAGAKGTGQQIGKSVIYWPWSGPSCDQADRVVAEIAKRHGVELVQE